VRAGLPLAGGIAGPGSTQRVAAGGPKRRRRSLILAQGWSVATTLGYESKNIETLKAFAKQQNPIKG